MIPDAPSSVAHPENKDKKDQSRRVLLALLFLLLTFLCIFCSSNSALYFIDRDKILGGVRARQMADYSIHAPLALDCSVSEHVKAGEDYYAAAVRGLKEEMGVTEIDVKPLIKFKMNYGPNDNEISKLYQGVVDPTTVNFDPIEIERVDYFSMLALQKLMESKGSIFSYWFEQIIQWYLGNPSALEVLKEYRSSK